MIAWQRHSERNKTKTFNYFSSRHGRFYFADEDTIHMLSFWQMKCSDWVKVISWFSGQWNLHLAPKLRFILAVLWDFMATRVRANVSRINCFLEVPCLIVTFTVCCNLNRNWFLEWAGSRQPGSSDHQWLWYENQIFINLHLFLKYW